MNSVLNRYDAFKRGDYAAASNPIPAELAGRANQQPMSLIDFDEEATQSSPAAGTATTGNDLADLFSAPAVSQPLPSGMVPQNGHGQGMQGAHMMQGQMGSIMLPGTPLAGTQGPPRGLGGVSPTPGVMQASASPLVSAMGGMNGMGRGFGMGQNAGWSGAPPMVPGRTAPQSQPSYFGSTAATGAFGVPSQHTTPQPPPQPAQQQPQQAQAGKDPFADLAGLF